MVVRVERVVEVPAPPEEVWKFIDDPEKRASPISVVEDFELLDDGRAVWHVGLPIPVTSRTVRIETENRRREPPEYVEFVGKSKIMHVTGEHELEPIEGGTRLRNAFTVDGRVPGVERFFKKNMDEELDNLEQAIATDLGLDEPLTRD